MKYIFLLLFTFILSEKALFAQEIQATKSGEYIVVMPDGSYSNYDAKIEWHQNLMKAYKQKKKAESKITESNPKSSANTKGNQKKIINDYLKTLDLEKTKGQLADKAMLNRKDKEAQLANLKKVAFNKNNQDIKNLSKSVAEAKDAEKKAVADFKEINKEAKKARIALDKLNVEHSLYPPYQLAANEANTTDNTPTLITDSEGNVNIEDNTIPAGAATKAPKLIEPKPKKVEKDKVEEPKIKDKSKAKIADNKETNVKKDSKTDKTKEVIKKEGQKEKEKNNSKTADSKDPKAKKDTKVDKTKETVKKEEKKEKVKIAAKGKSNTKNNDIVSLKADTEKPIKKPKKLLPENDVMENPPPSACKIAFEGADEFSGKHRKELANVPVFQYTDESVKKYYDGEDFLTCEAAFSSSETTGYKYLTFTFTFASDNVGTSYGWLEKDNLLVIRLIGGETLNLFNSRTDRGTIDNVNRKTIYKAICLIGSGEEKVLSKREVDAIRVMWSTGTEDYEIYDVDVFADQLKCLNKK